MFKKCMKCQLFYYLPNFSLFLYYFQFKEELPASVTFLENCLQALEAEHDTARMPMPDCFNLPTEEADGQLIWDNGIDVSSQEMICQV